MSGLMVAGLIIMAAVSAWGFTLARASAQHSRLRAEMARLREDMHREIRHWQEEAARAKTNAAQVARDAATWAAGRKQGRDDVIAVVPMLVAAQDPGGSTSTQHGPHESLDPA